MIEISRRRLLVDGRPRIVVAGEVHYFRVRREEWGQRLDLAREVGVDTIASYLPWIFHELPDGTIDVTGATRPERDVAAFVDLCASRGLSFFARPGPFVMAELKNEGLPYRLYAEHPEIVPSGWDGVRAPTATVDYLAPAFLEEADRWYGAIMPPLAERLATRGGPVSAVQLDNEVGMLAWVSNSPDLTPRALEEFRDWVREHRPDAASVYPALDASEEAWAAGIRTPGPLWAGPLRVDLARFTRTRFARYIGHLRGRAEALGVMGVPFVVNIHGTAGGGGESFGIGISQLVETYAGIPGMLSGSDHYVGDMTLDTFTDLYVMNAQQAAVHDADQPVTSVEFEAGNGDYGGGIDLQYEPSTVEVKTRLHLAQGVRLINYYLLAGGINPPLDSPVGDGNDRLSFTGERHGTAAPIGPEGQRGHTFGATRDAVAALRAAESWLADADQELDDLTLGLVLDAYATEYAHPASAEMLTPAADLRLHRGAGERRALARSALLLGYRFDATHLERSPVRVGTDGRPACLLLATARHMDPDVQARLVGHLEAGGSLLALGPVPEVDLAGAPCTVLADALGIVPGPVLADGPHSYPSVVAHDWAAPFPETRVAWRQSLEGSRGTVLLSDVAGVPCGLDVDAGPGRAVVWAAALPSSPLLFGRALERLGVRRGLELEASTPGVFATTTRDMAGNRLLHVFNVSGYTPEVTIGIADADRTVALRPAPHTGYAFPLGVELPRGRLAWANAELVNASGPEPAFGTPAGDALEVEWA
ncbi:MAG: beta-galactosidase [Propionibacteriaceae bacterium]